MVKNKIAIEYPKGQEQEHGKNLLANKKEKKSFLLAEDVIQSIIEQGKEQIELSFADIIKNILFKGD